MRRSDTLAEKGTPGKIAAVIRRRGRSRFPKERDPDYKDWIVTLRCVVPGFSLRPSPCRWGMDPGHVRPQSLGAPDRKNLFPICRGHHSEQEGHTREFEQRYGLDLKDIALYLDGIYASEGFDQS